MFLWPSCFGIQAAMRLVLQYTIYYYTVGPIQGLALLGQCSKLFAAPGVELLHLPL